MPKNKALFTVSESLKKDYVENFELDETKVFTCHPAVDELTEFTESPVKKVFTIGATANGGLNKGAPLLFFALSKLPRACKLKAKIISPKKHYLVFLKICFLSFVEKIWNVVKMDFKFF